MNDSFYISISFSATKDKMEVITALLMDMGFEGVEETGSIVTISIPEQLYDHKATQEVFKNYNVSYEVAKVKQQNWNAAWESSFEPVQVKGFVSVRASFHAAVSDVKHDIIITPKMSFGTGHHATTFLMMEEMQLIDFQNKYVIDFGTGTGVLAILAEKMGASAVTAIDNDEWSIANAEENIKANLCTKIDLYLADSLPSKIKADVMLANINLNIIINNLEAVRLNTKKGGIVLMSGLLVSDKNVIYSALYSHGFSVVKTCDRDNWMLIAASL